MATVVAARSLSRKSKGPSVASRGLIDRRGSRRKKPSNPEWKCKHPP